jgi:serine kinase of HPr protein (carbohydrate metabolism regulator)
MSLQLPETTTTLIKHLAKLSKEELEQFLTTLDDENKQKIGKLLTPKWSKYIPSHIQPTPKQLLFMSATNKEVLFGGSAGGQGRPSRPHLSE